MAGARVEKVEIPHAAGVGQRGRSVRPQDVRDALQGALAARRRARTGDRSALPAGRFWHRDRRKDQSFPRPHRREAVMTQIELVDNPKLEGTRRALVLTEDRVGHYPEFRDFFVRRFALNSAGLSRPGYVRPPSGMIYALVFIGRSGNPFPAAIEIYALPQALDSRHHTNVTNHFRPLLPPLINPI